MHSLICGFFVATAICAATSDASAYTVSSLVTSDCHERISSEALRRVRDDVEAAGPIAPSDDERAMIADLQFYPEDDMHDLGAVTMLLGVRDPDLKGRGSDDLTALAQVHGDPDAQDEHCLRNIDHDEPGGSERAIAACRAFIEDRVSQAIGGLGPDGFPSGRTRLAVHLAIRGSIDPRLPTFHVRMGQALHALQDGFSHTYRTRDGKTVTVALNWIEVVEGTHDEARDGPEHNAALDDCDGEDELQRLRFELATDASTALIRAAITPGRTREEKMVEVRAILDTYFGVQAGCSAEDAWCDAPEAKLPQPGCGCSTVGATTTTPAAGGAVLAALGGVLALLGRRRAPRAGSRATLGLGIALALATTTASVQAAPQAGPPVTTVTIAPTAAPPGSGAPAPSAAPGKPATSAAPATSATVPGAPAVTAPPGSQVTTTVTPGPTPEVAPTTATQVTTPATGDKPGTVTTIVTAPITTDEDALPPPNIVPVAEPGPTARNAVAWGLALTGGGSIDEPAFSGAVGGRMRLNANWGFGLDVEWNPWLSLTGGEPVRTGALNIYGSGYYRVPLAYESFNIRASLGLGTSVLLTDLYGAPAGTAGLFFAVNPLGLEYKASEAFYLIVNPVGLSVPIPQISGVPFLYPQYRLSVGIEFYAG